MIPERLHTVTRQRVVEHEQHSADIAAAAAQHPALYDPSEPVRNAQRLCAVSTEVVEADSASNAVDDCVLVARDFRTHIDFFAWYTSSILPLRGRRLKARGGAGDVVRHSTIQSRFSVASSAYATRRAASDGLAPSGADNVDGRPHLDGEGPPWQGWDSAFARLQPPTARRWSPRVQQ